jgi:hypothetical protein
MWEDEEQYVSASLPWQRLKVTAALVLQILALLGFAFLLARPFFREATLLGPHTVLVIDTSGSMATAGRFAAAQAEARGLADDASDAQLISVVDAGPRPRVVTAFSRDPATVLSAIDGLAVGGGGEDLEGALRLARGLATPDRPTKILLLSDGGVEGALLEPVSDASHILFDQVGDNVAITAFGTGVPGEGAANMFLEVSSFSRRTESISVQMLVDGLEVGSVDIELAAAEREQRVVPVDAGIGQTVEAVIVEADDANPLDDRAALILSGAGDLAVTVTGEGSPFLDALLGALPGVHPAVGEPPDVVVIDGGSAAEIDRPAWIIAPDPPPEGITVTGRLDNPVITFQRPGEPILEDVDLTSLAIGEVQLLDLGPGWLRLVTAGDVPIVMLGEVNGHRVVYFTFDVVRSNLPVDVTFPILGARILDFLGGNRLGSAATATAGTPLSLAPPPDGSTVVTKPDGTSVSLEGNVVEFADTAAPGTYQVDYLDASGALVEHERAVRQFAAAEAPGSARQIATTADDTADAQDATLLREWAPWILALLLLVVLVEWWVAYGRPSPWRRRSGAGAAV